MMRHALAMGAAVLAAVPVVSCETMAVSAEYLPTWDQWRELYDYNLSDPTVEFLYTDDVIAPYWRFYASAVMAVVEGVYINSTYEITPGNFSGYSGYYLHNGVRRFGSVYGNSGVSTVHSDSGAPSDPISVWSLQDGTLAVTVAAVNGWSADFEISKNLAPGTTGQPSYAISFHRVGSPLFCTIEGVGTGICDSFTQSIGKVQWHDWRVPLGGDAAEFTHSADYIGGSGAPLLGDCTSFGALPTAEGFETITADNALSYVSDVLNPYMVEKVPDVAPYLYDPNAVPYEPSTYPVQDTWAENAEWPEGNLLPTIPAASYSVDIPEVMTEGAAFWWRCLGVLFDGLGITAIVVGLLALGIVLYFVLR